MIGAVVSKNGKKIRLTAERWSHIVESHDYMAGNQDMVFESLEDPDKIISGGKKEFIAIKHYDKTSISEKHVIVIYKEEDKGGFVITAFMTSKPEKIIKKGVIWKR
ncbi:MAG TPA: hypothetical protein VI387_05535 [Candidatus Brocadiales bacterium]|nr:hypothetical protein [Candidatus Brocadiales bacterium]